jgi:hypothetical protein
VPAGKVRARRGAVVLWFALLAGCATDPASEEEWIALFDGHSLAGWQQGSAVDWTVADGVIRATEGEVGLLYTEEDFGDLELEVEFRAAPGTNSGVFLRSPPDCRDPSRACYEVNVAPPENPFPTGSLVGRARVEGAGEVEGWRRFRIRAMGGRITVDLDGEQLLDWVDADPLPPAPVGLQFNQGTIEFREVRARRLDPPTGG